MQGNVKQAGPCQASPVFACVSIKLGYHRDAWHSCSLLSSLLPRPYPSPTFHILANSLKLVKCTPRAWYDKHLESTMFHLESLLSSNSQILDLNIICWRKYSLSLKNAYFDKAINTVRHIKKKLGLVRVVRVETEVIKSTRMFLRSKNISGELKVRAGQSSVLSLSLSPESISTTPFSHTTLLCAATCLKTAASDSNLLSPSH